MKRFLFLALVVIAVGKYPGDFQYASAEKPMISPRKNQLVIQEGDELTIECYSEGASVQFSFPEYTFMSPRSNHTISTADDGTSTFLRQKTVSLDTGWYACAAEGVEIENNFKNLNHTQEDIAWIYIYVNSSEPFADRYYSFPKPIIVLAGSPAIVPCRPTSPESKVELGRDSEIVQPDGKIEFDPQIGFIIEELVFQDLLIHFHCEVNGVKDSYDLYYSETSSHQKPIMNLGGEQLIRENNELRIECYGESDIHFFFPNMASETDSLSDNVRTSEFEILDEENGFFTFLRKSTIFGDTGWYGCSEKGINEDITFREYIDYTRPEINWIYVYVQAAIPQLLGGNEMSVIVVYDKVEYVYTNEFIIPCLPTSPEFEVTLNCQNSVQHEAERFDPKYGFIVRSETNDSVICCSCKLGGATDIVSTSDLFTCKRRIMEQTRPFFELSELTLGLTGEDMYLFFEGFDYCSKLEETKIIPPAAAENRVDQTMWITPLTKMDKWSELCQFVFMGILRNVTENDCGEYILPTEIDGRYFFVELLIFDRKSWIYKKLSLQEHGEEGGTFVRRQNESLRLMVDLQSFGSSVVQWFGPLEESIESVEDYAPEIRTFCLAREYRSLLVIQNLTLSDGGGYQIQIQTFVGILFVNFILDVQVPPTTSITNGTQPYYIAPKKKFFLSCCAVGSPRPNITWSFLMQPRYPSKNTSTLIHLRKQKYVVNGTSAGCSHLIMRTGTSGTLTCTACNFISCSAATTQIRLSSSVGRYGIIGPSEILYIGDNVTLKCVGSIYVFEKLWWDTHFDECYKNVNHKTFFVKENSERFTIQNLLRLSNVTECHRRSYSCLGQTMDGNIENITYDLHLSVPQKLFFTRTSLNKSKIILNAESDHGKTRSLTCCAEGVPRPNITWFKNDLRLEESQEHYFFPETCNLIVVLDLNDENDRRYKCQAENRFERIDDYIDFVIEGTRGDGKILFMSITFVLIFIGMVVSWFVLWKRRKERSRKKFKEAILARFDEGALNFARLNVNMAAQAEVLPFDKKWEFPRNLLKFDKVLGSGAFGIVRKAEAKSICPGKNATIVAVKMVRATHRLHYMTALIRELKVLVHLGNHLNIVNLLGACTTKISYGELLVIVEFCRFGNLRDYLFSRRADFIDQIDSVTENIIDPSIGSNRVDAGHNRKDFTDRDADSNTGIVCHSTDARENIAHANEEALANGFVQPGLQFHYRRDDLDLIAELICTKDLLCWAWQVTRGMHFLGLRKVVHGDLAARNVLLADNNVIKICDFGLAEILYKDKDYKKLTQDPLPLQWMAIESITDRVFSTQSDIWSFGIVLWEIFTLAKTPYHGVNPRHLYQTLSSGYRLSRPKYAPEEMYRMMMNCWNANPEQRPAFARLEDDIGKQLDNGVHTYYMDMSPTYAELSNEPVESEKVDYLMMDPSELKEVSLAPSQEQVGLGNVPLDESRNSAHLSTSRDVFIIASSSAES